MSSPTPPPNASETQSPSKPGAGSYYATSETRTDDADGSQPVTIVKEVRLFGMVIFRYTYEDRPAPPVELDTVDKSIADLQGEERDGGRKSRGIQ